MKKKILYKFLPVFFSLLIVCGVPMRADAAVFPYTWNNSVFNTPTYSCDIGNLSQQYKSEFFYTVPLTYGYGAIDKNSSYTFYTNFSINISHNGTLAALPESTVSYYILIGGQKYYFGNSNWCYFDVSNISTDYFILGIEVLTTFKNTLPSNENGASAYCSINLSDFSYNIIKKDGLASADNQVINDSIQSGNNLINNQTQQQHQDSQAEINQSISNTQAEIQAGNENTDQITNGYSDQSINNADAAFNDGAGDLSEIEDNLSSSSSQYIDNYADSAFDASFLDTISPSLGFVVTWFTNFWNIGGGLTATFTLSFAIFIAFYIIRVRA